MVSAPSTLPVRSRAGFDQRRSFWIVVTVVVLVGLAWRIGYTVVSKGDAELGGDAFYYHAQASVLRDGHGFIDPIRYVGAGIETPTAGHPPLYALYLASWTLVGVDTPLGHRLVSCLLGAATIAVVAALGRRLGGVPTGIAAAVLAAGYPLLWLNEAMLLSESMAALTIAIALLTAYRYWDDPSGGNALMLGGAFAFATMARAEAALLFPLVVLPLLLRAHVPDWGTRLRALGLVSLAAVVIMGPWVARNLVAFERPVLLSNGFGATLRGSSCDDAWYGDRAGLFPFCPPDLPVDGDESERDAIVRSQSFDYIGDNRDRIPQLLAIRALRLWDAYRPFQNTRWNATVEGRGHNASFAGLWSYYLLMPLAIAGVVILWRRKLPVMPFLALAITVTFTAMITYANIRYRIIAEVGVVACAAVTIGALWNRLRSPTPHDAFTGDN